MRLFGLMVLFLALTEPVSAGYVPIWSLGMQNEDPREFGENNWYSNPAPGSATAKDNDYYFAGSYPSVGQVLADEPLTHFEMGLNTAGNEPTNRLHFQLSEGQATAKARVRISVYQVWGGWQQANETDGEGYGEHTIRFTLNGVQIGSKSINAPGLIVVEADINPTTLVTGANVLEITRTNNDRGWIHFDALTFSIHPTALLDYDDDGLPLWWEEDHGLNDSSARDAALDLDRDGLTNLQEFQRGTLPREADTDQDGLLDGVETATGVFVSVVNTGTNPLLADTDEDTLKDGEEVKNTTTNPLAMDTDGDGAADAWEVRTGSNPKLGTSKPPPFSAAIGIQFVCEAHPHNGLTPLAVTGLFPQPNWNRTLPLKTWENEGGSHTEIAGPIPDVVADSSGAATGVLVHWTMPSNTWFTGNDGASTQKLFSGYLNVSEDTPASVTLSQIPFSSYDVILYVGSIYDGALGYARLNNVPATDRWLLTCSTAPTQDFIEPLVSSATKPWRGNAVRYRGVTGSSVNVKLYRSQDSSLGIHGIQIVNMNADHDGDKIPDAWELAHRLRADFDDAQEDPDNDGLTNLKEYQRQTDPHLADTDGDGLNDKVETKMGTWVSLANTGTDPLLRDTDGDGLTDGTEAMRMPNPTDPNRADTDGDGRSDTDEITEGTDPLVADAETSLIPVVTVTPHRFDWVLQNIQIVWDHTRGNFAEGEWGDHSLISFALANNANPENESLVMGLPVRSGDRVSYFLFSNHEGAFSYPNAPNQDLYHSDWGNPPEDMKAKLGFSGHGAFDISDRLKFTLHGESTGAQNAWRFTFTLTNQDKTVNSIVTTETFTACRAGNSLQNGSVVWQDLQEPANINRVVIDRHNGVRLFMQATRLESTSAFAPYKDTDNDGMPDAWELTYGFNINSATDAGGDADNDGLTNLQEYLAGTRPNNRDSDGDGAPDGLEAQSSSNPLVANSLPPLYRGLSAGIHGEDFNGNGMSDAWELWSGIFTLNPLLDADQDGQSNAAEAVAGTDPFDSNSRLWSAVKRQGSHLMVSWTMLPYKQHQVWQSPDLVTWEPATAGSPVNEGSEFRQTFSNVLAGHPNTFYSAHVADKDSDGDGVSDWTEVNVTGTDLQVKNSSQSPLSVDANNDGIPDSMISGDYANLVAQFQGGSGRGGFAGGTGGGTAISRGQAARFLMQGAFGPTLEEIERVQQLGYDAWITEQITKTPTLHSTYIKQIHQDMLSGRTAAGYNIGEPDSTNPFLPGNNMMTTFARAAIQGEDQLRQRVAFALSQILVASRRDANLENACLGMASFYDIFVRHAFGNYLDVLDEVTLHPVMGRYLSHIGNQKANPEINQYPDENYAREVMQLFTIGLWHLNPDGSRQLSSGRPIPTYSNAEITHTARVMTGLWFSGHHWGGGGYSDSDYATPMGMHADRHDFGEKILLNGYVIPARAPTEENALRDIRDTIRCLFNHPNTGVFIGKQLIQFLVTDNPSPAYITRIAAVFANNGQGTRGDLAAVIRAILLDEEARELRFTETPGYGRLKEPVVRTMALGRAFGLKREPNLLWWDWSEFASASRQEPTASPSVFNFYRPEYRAPGLLTQNNLASPVFQITDSFSSISFPNHLWKVLEEGFNQYRTYHFPLDLARERSLAQQPEKLVDYLNTMFCGGRMKMSTRSLILNALNQIPEADTTARARIAAYLIMVCPEGAVLK